MYFNYLLQCSAKDAIDSNFGGSEVSSTCISVVVCLTLLASFFHLSFKNMYICSDLYRHNSAAIYYITLSKWGKILI